jgi:transcriptional regulator with GAF, ATPase, and Fis domain
MVYLIREALRKTNGQQKRAAQILGLRATLNSKMKRLKLSQKPNFSAPSNNVSAAVQ